MRVRILVFAVMLVGAALFAAACGGGPPEAPAPSTDEVLTVGVTRGTIAKDLTVYDANGNAVRVSDFRGSPLFLYFWSSYCPYCRADMPGVEKLNQQYGSQLQVVALSFAIPLPAGTETEETAKRFFFEENDFSYTFLFDRDDVVMSTYGIRGTPFTYLIAADGEIQATIVGPRHWVGESCTPLIEALIADEPLSRSAIRACQ